MSSCTWERAALGSCICPSHQEEAYPRRAPGFCLAVLSNPLSVSGPYSLPTQNTLSVGKQHTSEEPYGVWDEATKI